MDKIISKLYYGEIKPAKKYTPKAAQDLVVIKEHERLLKQLRTMVDEKGERVLDDFLMVDELMNNTIFKDKFEKGFKLGAQFGMSIKK
ncbi:hypothetical protein LJB83_01640 [Clostridia bacterium OttesenSCG-928-F22]|nr:hypothetical protein [Clostridia bacterium OttesenSCG-928-F22]